MKNTISIIGVLLIIFGIVTYSYRYFTYTSNEKIAEIGNVQVTAETEKRVFISPMLSGLTLAAGIVLVIVGTRRKS